MKQKMTIALLGATGKAGKSLLNELLLQGYTVKALIRNPEKYAIAHPLLEIVQGDIKDLATARILLRDCDAVLSAIGQINGEPLISSVATANIVRTMNHYQIRRYVFLTGITLDVPGDKKSVRNQEGSDWMRNTFPAVVNDKQKAYDILTESKINWTMVRLPWIDETPQRSGFHVNLEDCSGERIGTLDLADFLIGQITDLSYLQRSPFVYSI